MLTKSHGMKNAGSSVTVKDARNAAVSAFYVTVTVTELSILWLGFYRGIARGRAFEHKSMLHDF